MINNIRNNKSIMNNIETEKEYKLVELVLKAARKITRIKFISIIIISVILLISISACILLYNRDFGYKFSGESESFSYNDSMIFISNNKYYFVFGELHHKKNNIKSIDNITFLCEDRLIISSSSVLNGIHEEKIGYNELFPKEVLKNTDKWKLKIEYTTIDNQNKEEIIIFKSEKIEN